MDTNDYHGEERRILLRRARLIKRSIRGRAPLALTGARRAPTAQPEEEREPREEDE